MKKIIAILLLVAYSSTSFALSVKAHYCGGKFAGFALSNFGGSVDCGCDHTKHTHKGCCSDTLVSAKTDKHKTTQQYLPADGFSKIYTSKIFINDKDDFGVTSVRIISPSQFSSGYIRSNIPSVNILLCVFRI